MRRSVGLVLGFVGGASTVVNGRIFMSERSTVAKYALAAVTSIAGVAVFFVIASEAGCLFDATQCRVEPAERRHQDVPAG